MSWGAVEIANRALQRLGAKRISSLSEDSRSARSVNACFDILKIAELESHDWSFAIKRVILAEDSSAPEFTKTAKFLLPSDFIRKLDPDPEDNTLEIDWQIEGRHIVTLQTSALNLRYIANVTDYGLMSPLFKEAWSMRIAMEICEEITQSNTKLQLIMESYELAINRARKANAIQRRALKPPEDLWISVRK